MRYPTKILNLRHMRFRGSYLPVVVLCLAFVLACGGDATESPATSAPAAAPTNTTAAPTPTVQPTATPRQGEDRPAITVIGTEISFGFRHRNWLGVRICIRDRNRLRFGFRRRGCPYNRYNTGSSRRARRYGRLADSDWSQL